MRKASPARLTKRWRSFCQDRRGTIAMIFSMTIFVATLVVGLAIDGSRGYYTASKTTAVLDAAALAAAKAMSETDMSDDAVRDVAIRYINAHMARESARGITASPPEVAIDRTNDTVSVTMTSQVKTYFATLAGIPAFEVNRGATAVYGLKSIELGMMLDVSGSMLDYGKIDVLKSAASSMIEQLITTNGGSRSVKVGIAPYSTAVNAQPFINKVKAPVDIRGRLEDRCVTERRGVRGFDDESPGRGATFPGRASSCPNNSVVPLRSDKSGLLAEINALTPGGMTAGHLGIAWAWYLVSPEWSDIWPAESQPVAYTDRKTMKAVIVMTDGMFNTRYESGNGSSTEQAARLCANIKAKGIAIYTIGFDAPGEVLPLLRSCASSSDAFYDARDAAGLKAAFDSIAMKLSALRLSN